ncbi:MAG: caspase family protein, partial [Acidobacteriota bacterium]|nr:caspase family protein [Acidobacteriota bacterium]
AQHDGVITLWDQATGTKLRSFNGHEAAATSVRFSPDGRTLASGSADATARIWTVATGALRHTLKGHASGVNAVAFSRDGLSLFTGSTDTTVRRWNVTTGTQAGVFDGHKNGVNAIAVAPNGVIASGSFDARVKLGPATFTRAADLLAIDLDDWVVVAPNGRFDGSAEGLKLIHYVQNDQPIPLDSLFERLFTPRLLSQVAEVSSPAPARFGSFSNSSGLKTKKTPPGSAGFSQYAGRDAGLNPSQPLAPPPLVSIRTPATSEAALPTTAGGTRGIGIEGLSDARAPVVVEVTDQGGGADAVRLYHNGKLVEEERLETARDAKPGATISKTFYVALVPGANELAATALNRERTESAPAKTRIDVQGAQPSVNLYILAVGLNQYQNAKYNLNYGRVDAASFANEVEQRGKTIFKEINKQLIFDVQATRAEIEAAFERISKQAQPQDAFVFFYAGHGVMSEGDGAASAPDFFLVPYDVTKLYGDDEMLTTKAISAKRLKELCTKIQAQKQLVVFDACQSGGAVEAFSLRGASEEKAILQLARSAGVVVLAASGTEQLAAEFAKLGHGVFTYALLQGLAGQADGGSQPDGKITVKELEAYLNDIVPELSKRYRGKAQYPNSYARGQDFPLGVK